LQKGVAESSLRVVHLASSATNRLTPPGTSALEPTVFIEDDVTGDIT